jgi:hypothetical protein
MKVTVAHTRKREEVVVILDRAIDELFAGLIDGLQIIDERRTWQDSVMSFSFTGRVGFISVPLAGAIAVEDALVAIDFDLPPTVRMFLGEEKVRKGLEQHMRALVS